MEENKSSVKGTSIKWGAIHGLISIIFFVVIDMLGLTGNQGLQWSGAIIFVIMVFLAHKEFKSEGDGYMSYGQGLGIGTFIAVVAGMISTLFTYIYVSFINTAFINNMKEQQIMQMENQGMSDSEIDQAMRFSEGIMTPMGISLIGLVMGIFFGFIIALILSIFTKKSRPEII